VQRKVVIVLDAGEAFFLRRGDDFTVNDKASRGIMVESRYAEDLRHV